MATGIGVRSRAAPTFPASEVESRLRAELVEAAKQETSLRTGDNPPVETDWASRPIDIDSLIVVEILATVEPILGFELREGIVQAGGYSSVDEATAHLLPRIERAWEKKKGGNKR